LSLLDALPITAPRNPTSDVLESERLKAKLGEMRLERELLDAKSVGWGNWGWSRRVASPPGGQGGGFQWPSRLAHSQIIWMPRVPPEATKFVGADPRLSRCSAPTTAHKWPKSSYSRTGPHTTRAECRLVEVISRQWLCSPASCALVKAWPFRAK